MTKKEEYSVIASNILAMRERRNDIYQSLERERKNKICQL